MLRSALLAAFLFLALLPLSGCHKATTPQAGSPVSAPAAETASTAGASAIDLYNSKRYNEALARAEQDMLTAKDRDHEVAELTAGLSAYALNQPAMAQTYLLPLTGSTDSRIAGRAEAVLGQIAEQQGNHQYAADLFKRASAHLDGDDSARASLRAGNSLTSINRPAEAMTQYHAAAKEADSLTIKRTASKLGQPGPFTIQLGAFTSRTSAEKKVLDMRPATIKAGIGAPRIVADVVGGKPGFAVQVGVFADRSGAAAAKAKLGTGQYMIVSAN